jgi:hypothetical protein
MLTWIREKFGKVMIGGIVALLSAVFIFYGVFSPKSTRGMGDGAVAGTVNGDSISIAEFNRAYARQLEFFKKMLGGAKISDDQLKNFHIRENVFQELARRTIMIQQASAMGYVPSNEEIREKILEIPAFQKDGKFDMATYKAVLDANSYTPASFEKMLRDDTAVEKWQDYFRNRVNVSEGEIRQNFISSEDKRNIKYVLLTSDTGKKDLKVSPEEVQKFLGDSAKANLAKTQFESRKETEFKGKTFDSVKDQIARDLIVSSNQAGIAKANDELAQKVLAVLTANKNSDAQVAKLLKPYGVDVKNTGMVGRETQYVPGLGEAKDLMADAFAEKSPIDPTQGGKVKKYDFPGRVLIAVVSETQKPDLTKLVSRHDTVAREIIAKKERTLFEAWLKVQTEKAKIDANPSVVGGNGQES